MKQEPWGQSLAVDLHGCKHDLMINMEYLEKFSKLLCGEINMVPHGPTYVDRFGEGEIEGISSMQFIESSTITVHLDEIRDRAFIDVFSCQHFDAQKAETFCKSYFKAEKSVSKNLLRG